MTTSERPSLPERMTQVSTAWWFLPALFVLEVAETTFLPLPYEAVFIALCLAFPRRIWQFLLVTMLGSAVAGAILYGCGAYFGGALVERFGLEDQLVEATLGFNEMGGLYILLGGITPVPSYVINLTAGAVGYPFIPFISLFAFSRFVRFAILAVLLHYFGDDLIRWWRRIPKRVKQIVMVLFFLGFAALIISGFA